MWNIAFEIAHYDFEIIDYDLISDLFDFKLANHHFDPGPFEFEMTGLPLTLKSQIMILIFSHFGNGMTKE